MDSRRPRGAAFVPKVRHVGFFLPSDQNTPSSSPPLSELPPENLRSPVMILPTPLPCFSGQCCPIQSTGSSHPLDCKFSGVQGMSLLLGGKMGNFVSSPSNGGFDLALIKPENSSEKIINDVTGMNYEDSFLCFFFC